MVKEQNLTQIIYVCIKCGCEVTPDDNKELEGLAARDLSRLKLWGFDEGPDKDIIYLPVKKGIELDTSGIKPEPYKVTRLKAMLGIAGKLGRQLTEEENKFLTGFFSAWVTDEEIEQAIEQLARTVNQEIKTG